MECKGKSKRMKEEAPSKKLPPKIYGGSSGDYNATATAVAAANASTPTKAAHDEIISSLLRINNFDSISSIKDESLDIDLSACVTISSASYINGNSLSSTDFWRVLDESAQNNTELNLSVDVGGGSCRDELIASNSLTTTTSPSAAGNDTNNSEFNVTFLRPEPPNAFTNSPFKKISTTPVKLPSPEQMQLQLSQPTRKPRLPAATAVRLKVFKEEPLEEKATTLSALTATATVPKPQVLTKVEHCEPAAEQMPPAFSMFQQPTSNSNDNMPPPAAPQEGTGSKSALDLETPPPPLYKCLDCNGLVLDNPQLVSTHKAAAHRLRITYNCTECQREFELLAGLKKHLKTHRSEVRKDTWKKCPDCGKCLKLGSMWMHRKIHSDNKKYQCDICGQKFVQKINLTHHARIHSSEKPYECPECQKRFQERSHLQRHQKYHAQTRSYRCEKCGKMYKTERCLKVHNLVHLEQRPFACNVCDKSFISNSKLKQHSNIHTGMRPFKCNYCPRDFTNFPNWLKHTRRRHKVDHKTGEHLENIPSYCSKKSTTTKAQKAAAAAAAAAAATASSTTTAGDDPSASSEAAATKPNETTGKATPTTPTTTAKQTRKKKQPQQAALAALGITLPAGTALQQVHPQPQQADRKLMNVVVSQLPPPSTAATPAKQVKAKRERKQLAPKQLQQKPSPPPPTLTQVPVAMPQIKKEPQTQGAFLDLHGLSLTSAEDLIMEQALEMEECGLYDAPVVNTDMGTSDNAISSEAAAALHFQIKNELPDELLPDEDFLPHKPSNGNRLACPSLESSPFSSPASMELTAVSSSNINTSNSNTHATQVNSGRTANYYLPAFTLNAQGKLTSCTSTTTGNMNGNNGIVSGAGPTTVSMVNMPLLMHPNQMLPSVDTLLFTTQTGNRFFSGKTVGGVQTTGAGAVATTTSHLT
ncbi:serendipity locus protein H-1 [Drosophila albomicans]|uniref:Serendipity locus protein H-1 n=1 Tax=Drosophila albomicans TaxID=7291 RepID=A0A6P8X8I2_DROAB|nr:serendipity locus protein H-1 [Drosophila albomicans]